MMEEIWKEIPGFPRYELSSLGRVRNIVTGNVLKTYTDKAQHGGPRNLVVLRKEGERKTYSFYLYRLLWEVFVGPIPIDRHIDHKDGNQSNDSLENLRLATISQNRMNSKPRDGREFKGCFFLTRRQRWIARIHFNGKSHQLGSFKTEKEAAVRYNEKAIEFFGEYARLNNLDS